MSQVFTAFAPATVANVAVGFDILGFAVEGPGDHVRAARGVPGVRIHTSADIPTEAHLNTATVGILKLLEDIDADFGIDLTIEKGIPLGSGLGGSAASAVAGIVAADALLGTGLSLPRLLDYALLGEAVASGAAHPDNAAPCLYGGFTFARAGSPPDVVQLPVPEGLVAVIVHPNVVIRTRDARSVLPPSYLLHDVVEQTANLADLLIGAYTGDAHRFALACQDNLIEPHRARLIPGFHHAKEAAMRTGALAYSISGSGPTVFALAPAEDGTRVLDAMLLTFRRMDLTAHGFVSPIGGAGARIVEEN